MIDDESKKFIKETIENTIDNKLSEHDKKTQASKRLDELKYEKRSLEDRKKLLAELDNKDKKGQATIAEKFEKLKLSVDTAIPQDFKDAWKTGSQGVQAGASQVGKGIGHLTQRAMMSNPLTAFLYQNRDILGAVGDIGIGTAKAGIGALKGLGHGALGLANSVKNLFHKGEDEEQVEELNLPKSGIFNNDSSNEKIVKERNDWQKKIDVIHEIITRDLIKENKKSSEVLSKGLGGLNKTVEAVKGFTDAIASKQKLILGGILIGAAAIAGLVAWFKGGGLANLFLKNDNSTLSPETVTTANVDAGLSGKEWKDSVTQKVQNGDFDKIKNVERGSGWKSDDSVLGTWKHGEKLSKKGISSFKFEAENSEKDMIIRAPFDCYINSVQFCTHKHEDGSLGYGNEKGYYRIYIEKVHTKKQGQGDVSWSQYEYCIYPVYDPKFTKQPKNGDKSYKKIPKGTILGYAHGQYFIVPRNKGAYQHFEASLGQYVMDENSEFKKGYANSIENTGNFRTEEDAEAARKDTVDVGQSLKYNEKMNKAKTAGDKLKAGAGVVASETLQAVGGDAYQNEAYKKAAPNAGKGSATGFAVDISTNRAKAQEQKQKLNEKKEEPITEQNTTQNKGYSGQLPTLTFHEKSKDTEYSHADLRPTSDITLMMSDTTTNTGAL